MKPRVYIETTIPSYLTAWPSRDLIRSAHQQLTREWWAQREDFEWAYSPNGIMQLRRNTVCLLEVVASAA